MGALGSRVGVAAVAAARWPAVRATTRRLPAPARTPATCWAPTPVRAHAFVGAAIPLGRCAHVNCGRWRPARKRTARRSSGLRLGARCSRPVCELGAARGLVEGTCSLGFILDASDPRLAIAACAGSQLCASAATDIRATALALAPFLADYRREPFTSPDVRKVAPSTGPPQLPSWLTPTAL